MNRASVLAYAKKKFGTQPDYPWEHYPTYAVLRHADTKKWYGLIMSVPGEKFERPNLGNVDVINLKCDPILRESVLEEEGIFPAYHMNKQHWISVWLDGFVEDDLIRYLLDTSFGLTQ